MGLDRDDIISWERLAKCDRTGTYKFIMRLKNKEVWEGEGETLDDGVRTAKRIA